jgi:hypothetical protein
VSESTDFQDCWCVSFPDWVFPIQLLNRENNSFILVAMLWSSLAQRCIITSSAVLLKLCYKRCPGAGN